MFDCFKKTCHKQPDRKAGRLPDVAIRNTHEPAPVKKPALWRNEMPGQSTEEPDGQSIPYRVNRRYAGDHNGVSFDVTDHTRRQCEIKFVCQDDIYVKFTGLVIAHDEPLRCEIHLIEEKHGVQIERLHTVIFNRARGWIDYGEFVTMPKSRVFHITCGIQPGDKIKVHISGRLD